jgi:putative polyhydroxyalkanoate system protein
MAGKHQAHSWISTFFWKLYQSHGPCGLVRTDDSPETCGDNLSAAPRNDKVTMASIDIRHPHSKTLKQARAAVARVAEKIQERFEVGCAWSDDTLEFSRSGVNGEIRVLQEEIHVLVNLGFLLMALRGPIESEILRYLEREFS